MSMNILFIPSLQKTEYNSEKMFDIKTVPSCPGKILRNYQADEISGINIAGKFVVKTREKEFTTSIYPFLQTDHFVDQLIGKANIRHRCLRKIIGV